MFWSSNPHSPIIDLTDITKSYVLKSLGKIIRANL